MNESKHIVCFVSRSNFKDSNFSDFYDFYTTQSQNGSVRISLVVSDVFQRFQESFNKKYYHWLELNDQYLYVIQLGFSYYAHAFFSNALQRAIQELTDSGIIQHLFAQNYDLKMTHPPEENCPNVLTLHDLTFGFYIWIGAFCITIVVFIIEVTVWMCRKDKSKSYRDIWKRQIFFRKFKHNKVHPAVFSGTDDTIESRRIKSATLMKFKISRDLIQHPNVEVKGENSQNTL